MTLKHSPGIVTDGLAFYYDMGNTQKSWKGKPTTNITKNVNLYSVSGSARIEKDSSDVLSPIGTRDVAKVFRGTSAAYQTIYESLVLSAGTYTVSWYGKENPANKGLWFVQFNDGTWKNATYNLASHPYNGSTQKTTYIKDGWYRFEWIVTTVGGTVSFTFHPFAFDQSAGDDLTTFQYFWGLQMELQSFATPFVQGTRSNTQSIVDLTGNITLNANSLVYNDDNTFQFDGSTSWISTDSETTLPLPSGSSDSTMLVWCMPDPTATSTSYSGLISYGRRNTSGARVLSLNTSGGATIYISSAYWGNDYVPNNVLVQPNNWNMVAMTTRGSVTSNNTTLYRVNNSQGLNSTTGSSSAAIVLSAEAKNLAIGSTDFSASGRTAKGRIAIAMIYNRSLSEAEIRQNFNAMKERFYGYQTLKYINSSNVTVTGNRNILEQQVDMFKNANNNSWDGQVYSLEPFTAPCTIEFNKEAAATDNSVSYAMIGWNEDPTTNASYTSLDYAAYPFMTNGYAVYHNGSNILTTTTGVTWDTTKKLYVVYDTDGYIRHYNGNKLLYSVNYGTGKTVYVDSSFYSVNATYGGFKNVKVSRKSWNGTSYS